MKAFLSYSSTDSELVKAVAKELGRQFCLFDEQTFTTSDEFKKSIENALDSSSIFVFFASRKALDSIWVNFELEEAWYRHLNKSITKSIVYIIDSSLDIEDLPVWLRRGRINLENTPKIMARDIRFHLDELTRQRQSPYFVGRSKEIEAIEQALLPFDGTPPPHAVFIVGLPGVGRRSVAKNSSSKILNLKKHVEIRIREGDSIQDICAIIADHVEPYATKEMFEHIVSTIRKLSDKEAIERILNNLRKMTDEGELPLFYDDGGLLDSEGYIREPIQTILRSFAPNDSAYVFFISFRRPQKPYHLHLPVIYIEPLSENDVKRLVSMLSNQIGMIINPRQLSDLASYVAGYPPSAHFAIQQARIYGLDLVLSEKERLIQFRTSVFLQHLSKLQLDENASTLLRLLAFYSPLPLSVIKVSLDITQEIIQETIIQLIDLALVILNEDGYYRIADPVAAAAETALGMPQDKEHRMVARTLNYFLEMDLPSNIHRLELSRVLFRAASLANDEEIARNVIHFASDLVQLTEKFYHARRYEDTIKCGYMALLERPDSLTARSYLIRALIQEERWSDAEDMIKTLHHYAPQRDIYFLTGFLERKRGNISSALDAYSEAQRNGRRGVDISRELAYCYFLKDDLDLAYKYVEEALNRHGDNPHVVDLWAQIATNLGDEKTARVALSRLELVSKPLYYHHRASRIALATNKLLNARDEAQLAVDSVNEASAPFEVMAQLTYCEIALGNIVKGGELLDEIDLRFGNTRRDIRIGLRCRLEIGRGRYREALAQLDRIVDKSTFFYKKIRKDALEGEVRISGIKDTLRTSYENELTKLEEALVKARPEQFIPAEIDFFPLK